MSEQKTGSSSRHRGSGGVHKKTEAEKYATETMKQESEVKAKDILFHQFPKRIERLSELSKVIQQRSIDDKKTGRDALDQTLQELKAEIQCMVEYLGALKLWIDLNRPEIDGAHNFTVSVMDEIGSMLSSGRQSGYSVMQSTSRYFSRRAKMESDVQKHPRIHDYANFLKEYDEKTLVSLQQSCNDLKNSYILVVDRIVKNIDKLQGIDKRHSDMMTLKSEETRLAIIFQQESSPPTFTLDNTIIMHAIDMFHQQQ